MTERAGEREGGGSLPEEALEGARDREQPTKQAKVGYMWERGIHVVGYMESFLLGARQ